MSALTPVSTWTSGRIWRAERGLRAKAYQFNSSDSNVPRSEAETSANDEGMGRRNQVASVADESSSRLPSSASRETYSRTPSMLEQGVARGNRGAWSFLSKRLAIARRA